MFKKTSKTTKLVLLGLSSSLILAGAGFASVRLSQNATPVVTQHIKKVSRHLTKTQLDAKKQFSRKPLLFDSRPDNAVNWVDKALRSSYNVVLDNKFLDTLDTVTDKQALFDSLGTVASKEPDSVVKMELKNYQSNLDQTYQITAKREASAKLAAQKLATQKQAEAKQAQARLAQQQVSKQKTTAQNNQTSQSVNKQAPVAKQATILSYSTISLPVFASNSQSIIGDFSTANMNVLHWYNPNGTGDWYFAHYWFNGVNGVGNQWVNNLHTGSLIKFDGITYKVTGSTITAKNNGVAWVNNGQSFIMTCDNVEATVDHFYFIERV